ncbi:hypothetical protein HDU96_004945, partial [Phlyctochytrium bullatum]
PALPQNAPYGIDLVAGRDYYWCSCGKSKNQPFCDGSHKGTSFTPLKFSVDESKKYFLCGCKISDSKPFCDGTHRKEKGLKRYNEFLLKKNGELTAALAAAGKGGDATWKVVSVVSLVVAVGAVVAAKNRWI